ncbi:cupin domain-containing protein [Burkholderia pyrrocinia]|uniref:cupin domain-containing protein n=1 Tax=Burkholderia pyrrocinia TaxID=60550 RepID=UPI001BD04D20|nr:cupin domain-containing protein [Burkholderia pyrrocinia]QVN21635.1 cupin domain-containing protein [Burkholderia pyrrocinia]
MTTLSNPREILKAADIAAMEPERSVHPLNENAIRQKRSLGDATGLTQLGFHLMTLMPGHESTEYHRHLYAEECVYILSGIGEAIIDGHAYPVSAGDFMGFARGGSAHTMLNTGNRPLVYLVAGDRPEHDVCDYPKLGKRLYKAGADKVIVDHDSGAAAGRE